ncbi:MAG: hypothetical protein ACREE2_14780 [Stellaceae bacterium]
MRALVLACLAATVSLVALGGCADPEGARVESFAPGPSGHFVYRVQTNTVMTENDDGAAERIRRDWLAETLAAHGLCSGGYLIYDRDLEIPPQRLALSAAPGPASPGTAVFFGNGGDVVYSGRCL